MVRNNSGTSLIEALVALALLELVALFTLSAALSSRRVLDRIAAAGTTDVGRLTAIRAAAGSPSCRNAVHPTIVTLALPATSHHEGLTVEVRCGR